MSSQREANLFFKLSVIPLLASALLFFAVPMRAEAEETVNDMKSGLCKGLQPFNNLNELLYQLYINLDSDCLFEMPVEELEKAWGIKILDEERFKPKNYYPYSETEFYFKPFKSEKDAFYVEKTELKFDNINQRLISPFKIITLKPTKEYYEKRGPLFPENMLPKLPPDTNGDDDPGRAVYQSPDHMGVVSPDRKGVIIISPSGEVVLRRNSAQAIKVRIEKKDDQPANEAQDIKAADIKNSPCRGLKPFNDLEELLYQFYINLDSDCLFKMPVEELEKVWGIKILSDERRGDVGTYDPSEFYFKPYKSEKDAFYVSIDQNFNIEMNGFHIRITREYFEKNATLFPDGEYPKPLPPPKTIPNNRISEGPFVYPGAQPPPKRPKNPGRYMPEIFHYYWLSSDNTRMMELGGMNEGVRGVTIKEYVPPAYK